MTVVVKSVPVFESTEDMFKYIVSFLHKQGGPAYDKICQYRINEKACAVGCLIPDSAYNPHCEGDSPSVALNMCGVDNDFYYGRMDILASLQVAHDEAADEGKGIEDKLVYAAEHHKIDAVDFVKSFDWSKWGQ